MGKRRTLTASCQVKKAEARTRLTASAMPESTASQRVAHRTLGVPRGSTHFHNNALPPYAEICTTAWNTQHNQAVVPRRRWASQNSTKKKHFPENAEEHRFY